MKNRRFRLTAPWLFLLSLCSIYIFLAGQNAAICDEDLFNPELSYIAFTPTSATVKPGQSVSVKATARRAQGQELRSDSWDVLVFDRELITEADVNPKGFSSSTTVSFKAADKVNVANLFFSTNRVEKLIRVVAKAYYPEKLQTLELAGDLPVVGQASGLVVTSLNYNRVLTNGLLSALKVELVVAVDDTVTDQRPSFAVDGVDTFVTGDGPPGNSLCQLISQKVELSSDRTVTVTPSAEGRSATISINQSLASLGVPIPAAPCISYFRMICTISAKGSFPILRTATQVQTSRKRLLAE